MKDLQPINFPGLDPRRPLVIAGPCSAETEEQVIETARELAAEGVRIFRAGLWKPRTKPGGFEGVGAEGVAWLRRVKRETGMYTATEVATRKHVMAALEGGIDMIWIGARTTANPFAMQEIADALRGHDIPVLVKNPVSPDLELWIGGVERIYNAGIRRLGVIHRGFTSIDKSLYRNHPMWSIPIELHRRLPGLQIFCDPSHIGGRRELIAPLSQQAMDLGFDGLIVEAHCSPDCAWSDKAQQVTPQGLAYICRSLVIREANTTTESLSELRSQIDKIDDELLATSAPAFAGNDRPIAVGELPAVSQEFIKTHFAGVEVSFSKVDEELFDKDYKVVFVNGAKVEFAKNGEWKDVECKYGEVPAAIVPQQIRDYVTKNYPKNKIVAIDRDRRDYEVELDNGLDLKFDLKFRLIDIDN